MDLEDQGRIKELTEEYGKDDIVVLLGAPTTEASQVQFETVTTGDPSYAGPLAGVELGLQAYHVFEPNVKAAIDPDQYAENIEILEMGLDAEAIVGALAELRAFLTRCRINESTPRQLQTFYRSHCPRHSPTLHDWLSWLETIGAGISFTIRRLSP